MARAHAAPAGTPYPALILLDVNMPVMGGAAFLAAYQQLPVAQQASRIVLLTTTMHEGELQKQKLRQLPVVGLMNKPFVSSWAAQGVPTRVSNSICVVRSASLACRLASQSAQVARRGGATNSTKRRVSSCPVLVPSSWQARRFTRSITPAAESVTQATGACS